MLGSRVLALVIFIVSFYSVRADSKPLIVCLSGRTVDEPGNVDPAIFQFCDAFSRPDSQRIHVILLADEPLAVAPTAFIVNGRMLSPGQGERLISGPLDAIATHLIRNWRSARGDAA
jgi:hypothetical protein